MVWKIVPEIASILDTPATWKDVFVNTSEGGHPHQPDLPLDLTANIAVNTEEKARRLEKDLKTGSGRSILQKRIL